MNRLWQIMPSMAFKLGLYDGVIKIGEARKRGNFGVGQFARLDGELTVLEGKFYHARSDGSVRLAEDDDELCFAQLCFYEAPQAWNVPGGMDMTQFGAYLTSLMPFPNFFWAFHLSGQFANVTPTAPPPFTKPYPPFADAIKLRQSFPASDIAGAVVGFYSPPFTGDTGVPGFHYHFISRNGLLSGHLTAFEVKEATVSAARIDQYLLQLPSTSEYEGATLGH